jgi:hypothetical protein
MAEPQIRFNDGAGYERMMGVWSKLVGEVFLDWLAPRSGLRWIDVGCGNGAFTELIVQRYAPPRFAGSIPRKANSLMRARGQPRASRNSGRVMRWSFPTQPTHSTRR